MNSERAKPPKDTRRCRGYSDIQLMMDAVGGRYWSSLSERLGRARGECEVGIEHIPLPEAMQPGEKS